MINVKLIRKKGGSQSVGSSTGGNRYTGGSRSTDYATEAGHAKNADNAALAAEATHAASSASLDEDSTVWGTIQGWIDTLKETCLKWFLRKDVADTASGKITFLDGIGLGEEKGIDKDGNAELKDVDASGDVKAGGMVETDTVISKTRNDAVEDIQGGKGFKLWIADGVSSLIVDRLTVRMKAIFAELEVRKLTYSAGNLNLSAAGAKLVATAELDADGNLYHAQPVTFFSVGGSLIADNSKLLYINDTAAAHSATAVTARCWFLADDGETQTDQTFHAGDMVMCKTFNINDGAYKDVANKYYWRTVTDVSTTPVENGGKKYHWIDLSLAEACKIVKDTATDGTKTYYELKVDTGKAVQAVNTFPGYDTVTGVESDTPAPYDEVATVGSLVDEARRNVVQLVAVGEDYAPAVNMYDRIGEGGVYCLLSDHFPVRLSPKGCYLNTEYVHVTYGDNASKVLGDILSDTDTSLENLEGKYNDLSATVDGLTSRVGGIKKDSDGNVITLESEFKQTADEISLAVSSQRSGKNLWLNGGFDMTTGAPKYHHNIATSTVTEEDRIDGVDLPAGFTARLVFSCHEVGNGMFFLKSAQPYITLDSGNDYCLSMFIKATVACTVQIGLEGLHTENVEVGLGWNRVSVYLDHTSLGDTMASWDGAFVIYPQSSLGDGNYVCVTGIQFEVGSKASGAPTVWSKSIADTETALEKTGIYIKDKKITAQGDQFEWLDTKGNQAAYMDGEGNAHFNGSVNATDGTFNGTVNANAGLIGGWRINGNRLESIIKDSDGNPMESLDGSGTGRLLATMQLSTGVDTGSPSDYNLFRLPVNGTPTDVYLGAEPTDVGKVIRLYNPSPFGGTTYKVYGCTFDCQGSNGQYSMVKSTTTNAYNIRPQEVAELTCFRRASDDTATASDGTVTTTIHAEWTLTSRFGAEDFRNTSSVGRYPRMVAMGNIQFYDDSDTFAPQVLSGYLYDGRTLASAIPSANITVSGHEVTVTFASGTFPSGYVPIISPTGYTYALLRSWGDTSMVIYLEAARTSGVNIMILEPSWWYNMQN